MERWTEPIDDYVVNTLWPRVSLDTILVPRREAVTLTGTLGGWQPITIHFDGEIVPRTRDNAFKGSMFAAYPGDVVFSKIDARNGAIGIMPPSIPQAVVTPEYPVHTPDPTQIDGGFLHLLLRHSSFLGALKQAATGTTGRKRVTPEGFLTLKVPLPPLEEQRRLVAVWEATIAEAGHLSKDAEQDEEDAQRAFETALDVSLPTPLPKKPIFIARFQDIEQWSFQGLLRATFGQGRVTSSLWPMTRLGDIGKVSYGIQKSPVNRPSAHARPYLRVANVQRGYLDLKRIKNINIPDDDMPLYRLLPRDVLLCEGNGADLVGRGAIWNGEIPDCVHQNHILRVRIDLSVASPEYVLTAINSGFGQAYFESKAKRTTNLASINSKEVADFVLPLPPINEQQRLVRILTKACEAASVKRQRAKQLREQARQTFESALFAPV
jgi:type I restriction enzyme S subunit